MYDSGDESAAVLFVIMIGAVRLAQGEGSAPAGLPEQREALRDSSGLDIISIPENTTEGLDRATLEASPERTPPPTAKGSRSPLPGGCPRP